VRSFEQAYGVIREKDPFLDSIGSRTRPLYRQGVLVSAPPAVTPTALEAAW
jgi:hypothetical protein